MLTLRGHHLLCTLNYSGSGYTPAFIKNFDNICERLTAGEPAKLTWQPDSICRPMLNQSTCHCHQKHIHWMDFWGFLSTSIALRQWFFPPRTITLSPTQVAKLRQAFATGLTRTGCIGCSWFNHCTKTARTDWLHSKFHPNQKQ